MDRELRRGIITERDNNRATCRRCGKALQSGTGYSKWTRWDDATFRPIGSSWYVHDPVCPVKATSALAGPVFQGQGEERQCSKCGTTFTAHPWALEIMGHMVTSLGNRLCQACVAVELAEREQAEEAARLAEVAAKRRQWRQQCGIQPKFMDKDFSTFDADRPGNIKSVYESCVEYAEGFPIKYRQHTATIGKAYPSLVLFSVGVWGVGKTHLASAIAHRILDRWNGERISRPVEFVSEPRLFANLQATFNFSEEERRVRESASDILRRLLGVPLLILDDVGKEQRSDMKFVQRTLFALINGRYDGLRPLVMTTNKNQNDLAAYLGAGKSDEASFDRLYEMTEGGMVRLQGESYRRSKF